MDELQEGFQIATLVVLIGIVIVIMYFLLVFVNPQVGLNPFKPPLGPTATVVPFPATWTPTPTDTATSTLTPTQTLTPSSTPPPTSTPTDTPAITATRTRRPATNTPRPPTASPWVYYARPRGCQHSGGTFIEGYVTNPGGEESGTRVRLGSFPGGGEIQTLTTGSDRSPGYYTFVLNANGPRPGTYYVWIVDASGRALSDPNAARVTTNAIRNGDDSAACWQAYVDFARR